MKRLILSLICRSHLSSVGFPVKFMIVRKRDLQTADCILEISVRGRGAVCHIMQKVQGEENSKKSTRFKILENREQSLSGVVRIGVEVRDKSNSEVNVRVLFMLLLLWPAF